ncbi:MAG: ATP synthase F1 subunit epsilon [Alphaproteobacteria bacterium]
MAEQIKFEIISPAKLEASGTADMVIVPGDEGDIGFQAGRMPIMLILRPSVVYIMNANSVSERIFVSGGYAQFEDDIVRVLCEECFPVTGVSLEDANQRLSQSQESLEKAEDEAGKTLAEAQVTAAQALIYALEKPAYS